MQAVLRGQVKDAHGTLSPLIPDTVRRTCASIYGHALVLCMCAYAVHIGVRTVCVKREIELKSYMCL